jgi:hypothetical protein
MVSWNTSPTGQSTLETEISVAFGMKPKERGRYTIASTTKYKPASWKSTFWESLLKDFSESVLARARTDVAALLIRNTATKPIKRNAAIIPTYAPCGISCCWYCSILENTRTRLGKFKTSWMSSQIEISLSAIAVTCCEFILCLLTPPYRAALELVDLWQAFFATNSSDGKAVLMMALL